MPGNLTELMQNSLANASMDFKIATRTMLPWAGVFALLLVTGLITYLLSVPHNLSQQQMPGYLVRSNVSILTLIFPLFVLMVCYDSIARERASGGINLLLSVPNSRQEIFFGKVMSRSLIVIIGSLSCTAIIALVTFLRHQTFAITPVVGFGLMTTVFGLIFASIYLFISSISPSQKHSISGGITVYFLFVLFPVLPNVSFSNVISYIHTDLLNQSASDNVYKFFDYLNPVPIYEKGINVFLSDQHRFNVFVNNGEAITDEAGTVTELPVYLQNEFALLIAFLFVVVFLYFGQWSFNRANLG